MKEKLQEMETIEHFVTVLMCLFDHENSDKRSMAFGAALRYSKEFIGELLDVIIEEMETEQEKLGYTDYDNGYWECLNQFKKNLTTAKEQLLSNNTTE